MKSKIHQLILFSVLIIPLKSQESWQLLNFKKIPKNHAQFTAEGMNIKVNKSASPIIYPLKEVTSIKSLRIQGLLKGQIKFNNKQQGEKGADDYELKVGLVLSGDKRLNFMQKVMAANWVKKLYSLAPEGQGIDKILFLNAVRDVNQLNRERVHPLSELIFEKNVWHLDKEGPFSFSYNFAKNLQVVALWLSIDGDDTDSSFEVQINHLEMDL